MNDSLQALTDQQQPQPSSDMLVVRRAPNPDGSSRPIFTIVSKPSSSTSNLEAAADAPSPSEEESAAIYGESFWIDAFGCDPVMDVAPGPGRQQQELTASQSMTHHLVIDGGIAGGSSSGRQSRLLRYHLGPEGSAMTPLPTPTSPKLMTASTVASSGGGGGGSGGGDNSLAVPPPKMLQCSKCGKHFRNLYSLEHHICAPRRKQLSRQQVQQQEVDGVRYYLCPACCKPFKWIGNLTRHFHTHTGGRFFRCEICGKSFFTSYQVKRHMNSHLGVRYKCTICAKPFTCKYSCTWHIRQHLLPDQQQQQQQQQQPEPLIEPHYQQLPQNHQNLPGVNYLLNDDTGDVDMDDLEDADSMVDEDDISSEGDGQDHPSGSAITNGHSRDKLPARASSPVATVTVKTYCPID